MHLYALHTTRACTALVVCLSTLFILLFILYLSSNHKATNTPKKVDRSVTAIQSHSNHTSNKEGNAILSKNYVSRARTENAVVKEKPELDNPIKVETALDKPKVSNVDSTDKTHPILEFHKQPYKPSDFKNYIPKGAYVLKPIFLDSIKTTWSDLKYPEYMFSLAETESCIHLSHSRCFNTNSKLNTARETGVGIGQITIAYRLRPNAGHADFNARIGVRFDALAENKHLDPRLKDLNWDNITERADLQIVLMTAMMRRSYNTFKGMGETYMEDLRFADASYNGGIGATRQRILKCAGTPNCNKRVWFDNVEKTCIASRKALYGSRSACDINEEHVLHTTVLRLPKYARFVQ